MSDTPADRVWLNDWLHDYKTLRVSKISFLQDHRNLQQSEWAQGKTIVADGIVRQIFTSFCRQYWIPNESGEFDAWAPRHASLKEIAELARGCRKVIWLTAAASIFGCAANYPKHIELLELLDYVAVAAGSAFNAGYYGIHLCRVIKGCTNVVDHEIARFYGGRIYENSLELEKLRGGRTTE
jgi:hypothetical protein